MNDKTEFYIRWDEKGTRGILYIGFIGTIVSIKTLGGSSMRDKTLSNIILRWEPFREALKRALEMAPDRKDRFKFVTKNCLNGSNTYIVTDVKKTKYTKFKKIWHFSMDAKINEDLEIYVRDLVDWIQLEWLNKFSNVPVESDLVRASGNLNSAEFIEPDGLNCENSYAPSKQTNPFKNVEDSNSDKDGEIINDYTPIETEED